MASAGDETGGALEAALQDAQSVLEARRRAEEALSAERERLRITLASIGDGVISTDAEGRVTYLNGVAERLTGWAVAEAAGRPLQEVFRIVNQYSREPVENPALRALRDGVVVGLANHTILIARDGAERPIDDSAAPMFDGRRAAIGAVLVFRDVTERSRAHEARARLAAIVDSSDDAIVSKDLDGVVQSWNAGAERLFGWPREEAVGRPLASLIIPPDRLGEEEAILEKIRRGERVPPFETVRMRKDGGLVEISATMSPVRDDEGRVVAASKIARDVTAAKAAERAQRAAEERARFLADLAAASQGSTDPDAFMAVAARLLVEHMGVDRCAYAEVEDESVFVVTGDHARGVPSIVGRWPVAAFGAEVVRCMAANEPYVLEDSEADPRAGTDLAAFRATRIRGVICAPLHKDGRLIAAMAVHQATPRRWTPEEVSLLGTVVDRCWETLERARMARGLRESEARSRAIVETTPECVKLVAADGVVLQMNPAGLAMLEADGPGDVVGRSVFGAIAPEHLASFRAFHERVCRGEPGRLEFEIIGRRGTRRHIESSGVPLPAAGGGFHHMAVSRDVSERVLAARALAESRARLDYTVRLSGVGFWYCDLPFEVLTWDVRVKEHFHLPPDATVTIETFYERIHPEDREPTRRAIEASIAGHAGYDVDYRTVHPTTGQVKWIRALGGAAYAPDGTPTRFDGVTVDASARKLDEQRLARLLEREREQTRVLRRVADAALAIQSADSLEGVLRVVAEEGRAVVGAHQAVTSLTTGDDGGQAVTTVSLSDKYARWRDYRVEPTGQGIYVQVVRSNRPMRLTQAELEAHPAWRRFSGHAAEHPPLRGWLAVPLIGRDGRNLGLLQLSDKEDGEFTEADEAVIVQLAHIAAVAIENARLNGELREQDRRKDEFLALLAHELRNPLAPLRNGLQLMRLAADPATVLQARAMMDRQLGHMVRLIDDLLDVSRINQNKMSLRRERVLLEDVVAAAVETARPLIEAAGHELAVALPPGPTPLFADLTRLAQVFSNLLTNSAKYTAHGGRIRLKARREAAEVVVEVQDDGIGIPAESLPRLFDMFSQVDRSIERSTGGLGIGLALVKGLVEMHGGEVEAASEGPGRGSTFTVRLPALPVEAEAGGDVGRPEAQAGATAPRRVLVVDDNRDSAASMAAILRILGGEVRTAHDGLEAVATAEAFRPDVILMDVGMPRLNGYDATRRIREAPWGRAMVVIALTGWGQQSDRLLSREAGCDGHLVKPVDFPDLEKLLAELAPPR
ncbi:PAS domain S-box protein [Paludisphaera mucosa]|uniref:histidine kinase n=1 Tax=Paludisphaera mucosa TaxID=3030827 RepID=A0ABT6FHV9_9BACT|nr:PAS domain S-box protein [Paludisphaera mucosa]MDG3007162.1 PAS domain S-box protein [Paludisphaera mucosa]